MAPTAMDRRKNSALDYVPLTGPEPEGLKPGETFIHENVEITPELAEQFLAVNAPFNRSVNWTNINEMAAEMVAGEWSVKTPEGMAFSSAGELIDGQGRCNAVIKARRSIFVDVHHNYDPEVYKKLNRGRKRTTGHTVGSAGYANPNNLAAVVTMVERYRATVHDGLDYRSWRTLKVSGEHIVEALRQQPDYVGCWPASLPLSKQAAMNRTAAAACLFLLREKANGDADALATINEFVSGVLDPMSAGLHRDDPRTALYRNIVNAKLRDHNKPASEQVGLFLRAWQMWCEGERTQAFSWQNGRSEMPEVHVPPSWTKPPTMWGTRSARSA